MEGKGEAGFGAWSGAGEVPEVCDGVKPKPFCWLPSWLVVEDAGIKLRIGLLAGAVVAAIPGAELFVVTGGKPNMLLEDGVSGEVTSFITSPTGVVFTGGNPKILVGAAVSGCLPLPAADKEGAAGGKSDEDAPGIDDVMPPKTADFGGEPGGVSLGCSNELLGVFEAWSCEGWPKAEKGVG